MILRADPETRRKALYVTGLLTIFGIAVIELGLPRLKSYLGTLPPKDAIQVLNICMSLIFLSLIPWMICFYRFGRKVIESSQCPPPGVKVVRDTVVHTGVAARRRGTMLVVGSVFVILIALFASLYFPYMMTKMFNA
jgi:hypothetical protein